MDGNGWGYLMLVNAYAYILYEVHKTAYHCVFLGPVSLELV